MKRIITLITLFISLTIFSQEFKTSLDYTITNFKSELNKTKNKHAKQLEVYLYKNDEPITKLINLDKDDLDFFMDVTVQVLENPNLKDVKQIIKIEFEFLACCSSYESLYFIQTTDNEIVKLPQLDYMFCEYATDKMEYVFPAQKFGQENVILTTTSYLDISQKTESIAILNTQIWEEKDVVREYSYNYEK